MDNPLFLVTKGLKAKKKRLSGGGGGGIVFGTKAIAHYSKSQPTVFSTITLTIENLNTGNFYQDPVSNTPIRDISVSDYVAHINGAQNLNSPLTNGTATLSAGTRYAITIRAYWNGAVNTATPTGVEQLTVSVIQDTGNNVATGGFLDISSQLPSNYSLNPPYRASFGSRGIELEITPQAAIGTILLKLQIAGGTTDTDANVISGSAAISDSYYLRINLV